MLQAVDYRNSWIVAVDRAARPWPLWAALPYGVAVFALAFFGTTALFPALTDMGPQPWHGPAVTVFFFGVLLVGGLIATLLIERRGEQPQTNALRRLALGVGVGAAAFLLTVAVCAALGVVSLQAAAQAGAAGLALSAGLTLFGALAEEVFFRGWLQPLLSARLGPWVGVAITAVLFSAAHAVGQPLSPLAFVNGVLAGAVFGVLALRTGSLVAPVAAHFTWNWLEKSVLGLFPNPGLDSYGALFDLELTGAGLWTGGAAALNGALPTTLGLGLACAALILPLLPGVGRR